MSYVWQSEIRQLYVIIIIQQQILWYETAKKIISIEVNKSFWNVSEERWLCKYGARTLPQALNLDVLLCESDNIRC